MGELNDFERIVPQEGRTNTRENRFHLCALNLATATYVQTSFLVSDSQAQACRASLVYRQRKNVSIVYGLFIPVLLLGVVLRLG